MHIFHISFEYRPAIALPIVAVCFSLCHAVVVNAVTGLLAVTEPGLALVITVAPEAVIQTFDPSLRKLG